MPTNTRSRHVDKPRDAYYRDGGPRPLWRGAVMRLLLPCWPIVAVTQVLSCNLVLESSPTSLRCLLRTFVAVATSLNVFFSDRFHLSDLHGLSLRPKEKRALEVFWLRLDFTGISLVLSSTFALWACHFEWVPPLQSLTLLGFGATCLVGCAAFGLFDRGAYGKAGEALIKLTLGVQYVLLFGYMVIAALQTPCAPHTAIWFTYLPVRRLQKRASTRHPPHGSARVAGIRRLHAAVAEGRALVWRPRCLPRLCATGPRHERSVRRAECALGVRVFRAPPRLRDEPLRGVRVSPLSDVCIEMRRGEELRASKLPIESSITARPTVRDIAVPECSFVQPGLMHAFTGSA